MARTRNAAWLAALCALALTLIALSTLHATDAAEERAALLLAPVVSVIHGAVRPLADVVLHAGQLQTLSAENTALRERLAAAEADASSLRTQQSAQEQAHALERAGSGLQASLPATVVLRDPTPGRRSVTIDRGTRDGVTTGQPVLGGGGALVGVVTSVEARSARVRLLDDPGSAVTAVVQASKTGGALAGGPDGLHLEFVANGASIGPGDLVVTSPLGGRLPAGLLIGRVAAVHAKPEELFETVSVEPFADYGRLEQVLVGIGFTPGQAP